jgi:hypothetical protein
MDTQTGKRTSLRAADEDEALQIVEASCTTFLDMNCL